MPSMLGIRTSLARRHSRVEGPGTSGPWWGRGAKPPPCLRRRSHGRDSPVYEMAGPALIAAISPPSAETLVPVTPLAASLAMKAATAECVNSVFS